METLFTTAQDCLISKNLDPVVNTVTQILRKTYPKMHLPSAALCSSYSFPIPGRTGSLPEEYCVYDVEEEIEKDIDNEDVENKEEDDDLETDVDKLLSKPELDWPESELEQYEAMCPELCCNFLELESESENEINPEDISATLTRSCLHVIPNVASSKHQPEWIERDQITQREKLSQRTSRVLMQNCLKRKKLSQGPRQVNSDESESLEDSFREGEDSSKGCTSTLHPLAKEPLENKRTPTFQGMNSCKSSCQETVETSEVVRKLLERHPGNIPFHNPHYYMARAGCTRSIPDYRVLAFPDLWGHIPPPYSQCLQQRRYGVQRAKIFEDVRRVIQPGDIINRVVFDLDSSRCEYDLILNPDINSSQYHQWFYFEVSAMKTATPYRFNIINCEKPNSQFNFGMQPVMYSVKEALQGRPHWIRVGYDICYYKNHYQNCTAAAVAGAARGKWCYTLTFNIVFPHKEDVCYLAYHYPYTYSAMMGDSSQWTEKKNASFCINHQSPKSPYEIWLCDDSMEENEHIRSIAMHMEKRPHKGAEFNTVIALRNE
ncbi:hypothetical protein JD844_014575 [Phrynosoma platyrhinos]|uniref:Cytosolic carboxypeptidase N-terminal domain-containing protein n=1 Tax=Phrynosoma platyrhinos TaxID=52577 RepID=A0ABQ7SRY8_PHRPL|nr:hypothetical protein JD844_014575 [Phrynosoma platyrhinos]